MTALQMEKELLSTWHTLPRERQQQTLDFVQFLRTQPLPDAAPAENEAEYEEPHLVNKNGVWVVAGGSPVLPDRDWVAEMREERIRSFFPGAMRNSDESAS